MSFCSDVYLCCASKAFEKFKAVYTKHNFVPTEILRNRSHGDRLLCWHWVKWYPEYQDVRAILSIADELDNLDDKEYAYKLIEIGEDDEASIRSNEYGEDVFADIVPMTTICMGEFANSIKNVVNATFTSVWDGGIEITTDCKVDLDTKQVFDIGIIDKNVENLDILEREYVTFNGENYDVSDNPSSTEYWYD